VKVLALIHLDFDGYLFNEWNNGNASQFGNDWRPTSKVVKHAKRIAQLVSEADKRGKAEMVDEAMEWVKRSSTVETRVVRCAVRPVALALERGEVSVRLRTAPGHTVPPETFSTVCVAGLKTWSDLAF